MRRGSGRWHVAALAGVLLLALGLRLINLGGRTLWYDEAFAVLFSDLPVDKMIDATVTADDAGAASDVHPLLYYAALGLWADWLGDDAATVRLLSVLIGVLTVAAVYGLVRDWFGETTGLAAALTLAVAPFHVQYSQEARMYALLAWLLTGATWAYWRAWQGGQGWRRWGYWLVFSVCAAASMYTQQLAGFYLVALGLVPFLARDKTRIRDTVLAGGLAIVLYLPWLRYLPDQVSKLDQYWVQRPNVLHIWLTLRSFTSVNLDFAAGWWLPTFLMAAVLTVFVLWRGISVMRSRKAADRAFRLPVGWMLWLAFAPMLLMWLASQIAAPMYLTRALLPSAVLFFVALGWLFTRADIPVPIRGVLIVGWGVIVVFSLKTHYQWESFPNAPFDDGVAYLRAEVQPGDVIVHANKITALPMHVYGPELPQVYVRDIPDTGSDTLARATQDALGWLADACVAQAAGGAPRVWFVTFEQFEDEMRDLIADDPANMQYDSFDWLRRHYQETGTHSFSDLDIYLFAEPDAEALIAQCDEMLSGDRSR